MRPLARTLALPALIAAFVLVLTTISPAARGDLVLGSRDVVVFGRNATIDRPVDGNVHVVFGSVTVRSSVRGDVIAFGGNVEVAPGGHVGGEVAALGGKITGAGRERLSRQARVSLEAMNDPGSMIGYALKLVLLLGWILAAVALVLFNGREVRATSVELRASPYHTFALGVVGFTSFVLTAIVFSYLIPYLIGIPLLSVLALIALATKIFGLISVFHVIGTLVARPKDRQALASRRMVRGDLAMVLIGAVILGALRMIPVVGNLLWMTASIFGVGAALATKFGRREPWFLAWAPVVERS